MKRKEQDKEAQALADYYSVPGWDEVFADFDELGRLIKIGKAMTPEQQFKLRFIAEDLRNRNIDVRGVFAQCGENDGAAEEAISDAAKLIDRAARRLEFAAQTTRSEDLRAMLRLSIRQVRERRHCEQVGGDVLSTNEKDPHANVSPFLSHQPK